MKLPGRNRNKSREPERKDETMPRPQIGLGLTPEQRALALEKAAEARAAKSELLSRIRSGAVTAAELLSPEVRDERILKLQVLTMLRALPGVSPAKARNIMSQATIADNRRVGGLGDRQREKLLAWLS